MPEQHAPVQESARAAAPAAALPLLRSEAVRHPRPVAAAGQTRVLNVAMHSGVTPLLSMGS